MLLSNELVSVNRNELVNLLGKGVKTRVRLEKLNGAGRLEDWPTCRSLQTALDEICHTLGKSKEVLLKDYENLRNKINSRHHYHALVREWVAIMKQINNQCVSVYASSPHLQDLRPIAYRLYSLQNQLGKYIDVTPITQARAIVLQVGKDDDDIKVEHLSTPEGSESELEEGEIREWPLTRKLELGNLMKRLYKVEKGYQRISQHMKEYEGARIKDAEKLHQLEVDSKAMLDKATKTNNRLAAIPTSPFPEISQEILSILGSDEVTEALDSRARDIFQTVEAWVLITNVSIQQNFYKKVWSEIFSSLAVVDVVEPQVRAENCTSCHLGDDQSR